MDDAAKDSSGPGELAHELRIIVGQLRRRLRQSIPTGGLTASEIVAVGHIARDGPLTVTALARAEGVRPQSMGAVVAALQTAGLLATAPDPADGRQSLISLSPAGETWLEASRAAREDWLLHAIEARFTDDEQRTLAEATQLLKRLLGD